MLKLLSLISGFILLTPLVGNSQNVLRNYVDLNGQKQGQWIILGEDQEDSSYCAKCTVAEGHFLNNEKVGQWNYYNPTSGILERIEAYKSLNLPPIQTKSWIAEKEVEYDLLQNKKPKKRNQIDEKTGAREGYWEIYGYMKPNKGFADSCVIEKGMYVNDKKQGVWFKYFKDDCGQVRLIGTYENNRPNGDYIKYFESGFKREEGTYFGGRSRNDFKAYYENGQLKVHVLFCENKIEDSLKIYYHRDGSIHAIFDSKISDDFHIHCTYVNMGDSCDIKNEMKNTHVNKFAKCNVIQKSSCGYYFNDKDSTELKNLYRDRMGWSHTFNDCEEVEFDGIMKDGKPWKGKKYIYDEKCILLKIEIWSEGKFERDGAL